MVKPSVVSLLRKVVRLMPRIWAALRQVVVRVSEHLEEQLPLGGRLKLRIEVLRISVQPVLDDTRQFGKSLRFGRREPGAASP